MMGRVIKDDFFTNEFYSKISLTLLALSVRKSSDLSEFITNAFG